MKVGDLVQLLEPHGVPVPDFVGVVTGFRQRDGYVHVYWQNTGDNYVANAWPWGRLEVISESR